MRSTHIAAALILGGGMLVAACGDDDDDSADPPASTEDTAEESEPETVEITAVDYGFDGVPATMSAGGRLTLTNSSDVELHELVAMRIPDDEERPVSELVQLPEDELNVIFPEDEPPATVLIAPPGEEAFPVVGDGTLSEPGRYGLLCFIPTGADPEEFMAAIEEESDGPPDVEGGPPTPSRACSPSSPSSRAAAPRTCPGQYPSTGIS